VSTASRKRAGKNVLKAGLQIAAGMYFIVARHFETSYLDIEFFKHQFQVYFLTG